MAFHRIKVLMTKQMPNASWTLAEHISSGLWFVVSQSHIVENEVAVFHAVAYLRPYSNSAYDFDIDTRRAELFKTTEMTVDTLLAKLDNGDVTIKVGRK
jgi:hypothetical protein